MDIQSVQDMQAKHTKELDRLTNVMKGMELGYQDQLDKLRDDVERLKVLAIKHCPITHIDFNEICNIAKNLERDTE